MSSAPGIWSTRAENLDLQLNRIACRGGGDLGDEFVYKGLADGRRFDRRLGLAECGVQLRQVMVKFLAGAGRLR